MTNQIFKGELISAGMNAKTIKGDKLGEYATAIMYLAPADTVPGLNLCPFADIAKCKTGCLNKAGRGKFTNVQQSRIRKAKLYRDNKARFMQTLVRDLERFQVWCAKRNVLPAVRLNGTSDIQFERGHPVYRDGLMFPSIFAAFPDCQFYDYSKIYQRPYKALPVNYHLTLSYSEASPEYAQAVRKAARDTGTNVAIVYRSKALRDEIVASRYNQLKANKTTPDPLSALWPVINGDETDLRFTDGACVTVGLYAKGPARNDTSGFVID